MQNAAATSWKIAEEDRLRADLYGFLSALLAAPPDKELLARTALLEGDETPLGRSIAALAKLAGQCGPDAAEREFNALFIGLGRGELLPYASYYMTGFLNEKPLALLRKDMAGLGISRAANVFEPEDNIASLCEMMAGLIVKEIPFLLLVTLAAMPQVHWRTRAPYQPHGHGFADATSRNELGSRTVPCAREIVTQRSSSGWRRPSIAARENSGSSSRNSTPLWASEISPGRGGLPPPSSAAGVTVWCGARNGRSSISPRSARPTAE